MDTVFGKKEEKKGINKILVIGIIVAVVLIGGAIGLISMIPPIESSGETVLEGAHLPGTPEFEEYTKEIILTTDTDRLMQSLTGLGKITMHVGGSVYNKGDRALSGLQVNVGVIDSESKVIREKKFILVPNPTGNTLEPGKKINVNVNIGGFTRDDDRANVRWKVTAIKFQ